MTTRIRLWPVLFLVGSATIAQAGEPAAFHGQDPAVTISISKSLGKQRTSAIIGFGFSMSHSRPDQQVPTRFRTLNLAQFSLRPGNDRRVFGPDHRLGLDDDGSFGSIDALWARIAIIAGGTLAAWAILDDDDDGGGGYQTPPSE